MTKKTIQLQENNEWLCHLNYCTREDAIEYLRSLPDGCRLEYDSNDYGISSYISVYREETDKEYLMRTNREEKAKTKQSIDKVKRVASLEKELAKLKKEIK